MGDIFGSKNIIGDLGEEIVSDYFSDKHTHSKVGYNLIFKSTLRAAGLVGDGRIDYEQYMDLMYARDDDDTGTSKWYFIQVKTTCNIEMSSYFKFMLSARSYANYKKLSDFITLDKCSEYQQLPETRYLIFIVRRDGVWWANMNEVLAKGTLKGNFMTVNGVFQHLKSLTTQQMLELNNLCEINKGTIIKNNSCKELDF